MGMSSWCCAKTQLPVLASVSCNVDKFCHATLLFADGRVISGIYDGYGRLINDGVDLLKAEPLRLYESMSTGTTKWVLTHFYQGEKFEDLGRSGSDPNQGHYGEGNQGFGSLGKYQRWWAAGGFPNRTAFSKAVRSKR